MGLEFQAHDFLRGNSHLQPGMLGGQAGIPAILPVVLIGAAIASTEQATATTRTKVLTARFIHFLLTCGSPGSGNPNGRNYILAVKFTRR